MANLWDLTEETRKTLNEYIERKTQHENLMLKVFGSEGLDVESINIALENLFESDEDVFETFADTYYEEFLEYILQKYPHLFVASEEAPETS